MLSQGTGTDTGAGFATGGGGAGGGGAAWTGGGVVCADASGTGWACEHAARAATKNVSFRVFIAFSSALRSWDHPGLPAEPVPDSGGHSARFSRQRQYRAAPIGRVDRAPQEAN